MASTITSGLARLIAVLALAAGIAVPVSYATKPGYAERPTRFPDIESETECPVSVGSRTVVSSSHPYIFGAGGHFFGKGPVYFGLAWKPADRAEARFELVDRMPRLENGFRLKTPWVMNPEYQGTALVRGARIVFEATGGNGAAR